MPIPLSVIVPTFRRAALLEKIIESIELQSNGFEDIELIVCDSESTDGTADLMAGWVEKRLGSIRYINTTNNVSRKRNEGLTRSTHDIVIFLDDDCVPTPNFIETYRKLAATYLTGDSKVVLCGETRFPEQWVAESNYYRFQDNRHFSHGVAVAGAPLDFRTIVTMNMCVRKSTFIAEVRGFDESFVGYGAEDQELGWRLQQNGFSIRTCEACAIHHEMSRDVRTFGDKIRRTARDGMTQLLLVAPDAARLIRQARMLDPHYPDRTPFDIVALSIFRAVLALRLHTLLSWLLIKTDSFRAAYCPPAYRAYMACCYALGADQRVHRLSASEAAAGWVGKKH